MAKHEDILEVQGALKRFSVRWSLKDYAVGVLLDQQNKYTKEKTRAQERLKVSLARVDKTSPEHEQLLSELNTLNTQPDRGFFYTIHLFDQLNVNPKIIKRMMRAVLALDTMGRYLFEEMPISFDGTPFILDQVLQRRNIDVTALKKAAQQNKDNTVVIGDSVTPIDPLPPDIKYPVQATRAELFPSVKQQWVDLGQQDTASRNSALLLTKALRLDIDFDLISQSPTEIRIHRFLSVLTEILKHAKMQDSANLLSLCSKANQGELKTASAVAVVRTLFTTWFLLSLVNAPNNEISNQRLEFIMATLATVFRKKPDLPADATADLYHLLFAWVFYVDLSVLKQHPVVAPYLPMINEMKNYHTAPAMIQYARRVVFLQRGRMTSLPPMRLTLVRQVEVRGESVAMLTQSSALTDRTTTFKGKQVNAYFNPKHERCCTPLREPMSDNARAIWSSMSHLESFFIYVDGHEHRFLASIFAIHKPEDTISKQVRMLADALRLPCPRIYYYKTDGVLVCIEGREALDYIEMQVSILVDKIKAGLDDCSAKVPDEVLKLELEYDLVMVPWCSSILKRVEQLKSSTFKSEVSVTDAASVSSEESYRAVDAASTLPEGQRPRHSVRMFSLPAEKDALTKATFAKEEPGFTSTTDKVCVLK